MSKMEIEMVLTTGISSAFSSDATFKAVASSDPFSATILEAEVLVLSDPSVSLYLDLFPSPVAAW